MNRVLFSMAMAFTTIFSVNTITAQEEASGPKIQFNKDMQDYGELKNGADGTHTFTFKNTGDAPLIISNAKGSCMCTVPSYTKEPVNPGKTGSIIVKYDTKRPGVINKSVTITSNAVNDPVKILRIKGNVGAKPAVVAAD